LQELKYLKNVKTVLIDSTEVLEILQFFNDYIGYRL